MDGFGIILIDKEDKSQYEGKLGDGIKAEDLEATIDCFNNAKKLVASISLLVGLSTLI